MSKLIRFACAALIASIAPSSHAQETSAGPVTPVPVQEPAAVPTAVPTAVPPAVPASKSRFKSRDEPKAAAGVAAVTINGSRAGDTESRRLSTAAKMVFGREELDRNGDSSVGEILKRLPGVTMGGPPGRGGGGVRMRGLGNGYTQMLVNGERPPAGFSLESLSPDQVERIEVMRGPVAEHSTQAIAGTINVVLREGYQQKDVQLKLSDSIEDGRHGPNVSLTMPGKVGALTWLMSGSVGSNRQHDESVTTYQDTNLAGLLLKDQQVDAHSNRSSRSVHLTPRLSYKFDNGDTLNFQPFLMYNRSEGDSDSRLTQRIGPPQREYAVALASSNSSMTMLRGFGNWLHRMDAGAKLDVKFGFGGGRGESTSLRKQYGDNGVLKDYFSDVDTSRSHSLNSGGKYSTPLAKGHLLAAGWDLEGGHRTQSTVALVNGRAQFAESGSSMTADTRRVAGYVQDEWDITPQWSSYLGLRWEGIRTSATNQGRDVRNNSKVWSPVLHTVWRIPGFDKDQVRASLTRSYRAPQLNDLIAVPTYSQLNSATRPDRTGNPNLKPELAQGLDLAYEHYLGKSGILSASGFVRKIDKLMRRELTLRDTPDGPRWLSSPSNIGSARTSGIELEAKFQLAELVANAPNIDLRSNYSHFWSTVEGIPGPDNRLDQQAKQTANVGLDWRLKEVPLTLGGSYNWTPAILVRTSADEVATTGVKRQFDAYGLWKISAATQLRLSANNLLNNDYLAGRSVTRDGIAQLSDMASRTYTTWTIRLEMKL
ncbi:TonB-dependent receptor plug domain-containing protein [Massilia antarctica]|uniref:TonB-dependent receptor plug domain-containing protein n=1 Tax=Massilia antarctica TaxID=2765360 RepID=UPI0006BB8ABF|nr:TonB-dependent receptor [Massilia sp. H27-R4]MCY0912047.1 TonB-dependent receptor [Massilia sp. H27-R4]CUI06488.1 TonB-dependent receptor; Outer membrane receptor for ferrienterochelin and colicins [Janthinobacterium sp. CG23_2]CUU30274.1 TonB-dependent receptor; Outer membrane receptor for ferrienterochelin and colicins [Janthinobacterium sp. CG23_2]